MLKWMTLVAIATLSVANAQRVPIGNGEDSQVKELYYSTIRASRFWIRGDQLHGRKKRNSFGDPTTAIWEKLKSTDNRRFDPDAYWYQMMDLLRKDPHRARDIVTEIGERFWQDGLFSSQRLRRLAEIDPEATYEWILSEMKGYETNHLGPVEWNPSLLPSYLRVLMDIEIQHYDPKAPVTASYLGRLYPRVKHWRYHRFDKNFLALVYAKHPEALMQREGFELIWDDFERTSRDPSLGELIFHPMMDDFDDPRIDLLRNLRSYAANVLDPGLAEEFKARVSQIWPKGGEKVKPRFHPKQELKKPEISFETDLQRLFEVALDEDHPDHRLAQTFLGHRIPLTPFAEILPGNIMGLIALEPMVEGILSGAVVDFLLDYYGAQLPSGIFSELQRFFRRRYFMDIGHHGLGIYYASILYHGLKAQRHWSQAAQDFDDLSHFWSETEYLDPIYHAKHEYLLNAIENLPRNRGSRESLISDYALWLSYLIRKDQRRDRANYGALLGLFDDPLLGDSWFDKLKPRSKQVALSRVAWSFGHFVHKGEVEDLGAELTQILLKKTELPPLFDKRGRALRIDKSFIDDLHSLYLRMKRFEKRRKPSPAIEALLNETGPQFFEYIETYFKNFPEDEAFG